MREGKERGRGRKRAKEGKRRKNQRSRLFRSLSSFEVASDRGTRFEWKHIHYSLSRPLRGCFSSNQHPQRGSEARKGHGA